VLALVCHAHVEAAGFAARASSGRRLEDVGAQELAGVHRAMGDAWYQTAEFKSAADAYAAARRLVARDPLSDSDLLLKLSRVESKLNRNKKALRLATRARAALKGLEGQESARQFARVGGWYGMLPGMKA
jgi:hypothetical protein